MRKCFGCNIERQFHLLVWCTTQTLSNKTSPADWASDNKERNVLHTY